MATAYGGGLKANALSMHFARNIKPNVKLVLEALARGEDPLEIVLMGHDAKGNNGQTRYLSLELLSHSSCTILCCSFGAQILRHFC